MARKLPARNKKTLFCFGYQQDLDDGYAFYCARYKDISWEEFLKLGINEFKKKLGSIPETEPLFNIIKSRTINLSEIKNKDERKYWRKLKQYNKIPQEYLSIDEIYDDLKSKINKNGL